MTYYGTFTISNLTLKSRLNFTKMSFLNKELYKVFFLILFFLLKNKLKYVATLIYSKNQIFTIKLSLIVGETHQKIRVDRHPIDWDQCQDV